MPPQPTPHQYGRVVAERPVGGPTIPYYEPTRRTDQTVTRRTRRLQGTLAKIEYIARTMKCGLHSNIPMCCILWFTFIWRHHVYSIGGDVYRSFLADLGRAHPRYIPCPACLARRRFNGVLTCGCLNLVHTPYPPLQMEDLLHDD